MLYSLHLYSDVSIISQSWEKKTTLIISRGRIRLELVPTACPITFPIASTWSYG